MRFKRYGFGIGAAIHQALPDKAEGIASGQNQIHSVSTMTYEVIAHTNTVAFMTPPSPATAIQQRTGSTRRLQQSCSTAARFIVDVSPQENSEGKSQRTDGLGVR